MRTSRIFKTAMVAAILCSLTGCATALIGASAVGAGSMIAADSRSTGSMIDDEAIELRGEKVLSNNREQSEASNLDIYSVNGIVLLAGQCPYKEYIEYINDRVSKIDGVKKVYNYIEQTQPVSMGQSSQDSWITSKVKTGLLFGEKINSGRFKVVTENSVVYLLGYVTRDEAARAVYVTKDISGVRKIVKLFDYIEDNSGNAPVYGTQGTSNAANEVQPNGATVTTGTQTTTGSQANQLSEPTYFEETNTLEQPTTLPVRETVEPVNVVQPSTSSSSSTVTPVVTTPSSGPIEVPVPAAGTVNNSVDDSFIIE